MEGFSVIRKMLPYTTVACVLALLYSGWTLFSRWNENRANERAAEAGRARANAKIVEMYGSGNLKILNFYATPGSIRPGEKTLLCFGVANAASVRIEPGVEPVKPSLSRCVPIAPRERTEYKLTAEDAAGHKETASIVIQVK